MSSTTSYRIRVGYTLAIGCVIGWSLPDILTHTDMALYAVLLVTLMWVLNRAMIRQYERLRRQPTGNERRTHEVAPATPTDL